MAGKRCARCGIRVGWVGLFVDTGLVFMKLFVGVKTGSRAIMADALYSIVDVVSAFLVIASFKVSRKGVDENHPYGRGKIEYLAIASVSICVAMFAAVLLHRVIDDLIRAEHRAVNPMAAAAAAISIAACFLLWKYAKCAGTRLNSPIILTHAEHNKADAISSFAVLLSIALSWVGLGVLDPIVALLEIIHILGISYFLFKKGLDGLLDAPAVMATLR